jgi:bacteriocin biosynthesis cyclodehydratase domain-containing protein
MSRIYSMAIGPFGEAAQGYLGRLVPTTCVVSPAEFIEHIPKDAGAVVLFSAIQCHDLCKHLTRIAFECQHPFLPVVIDGRYVVIGPVTAGGGSGCWQCWQLRARQHDSFESHRSYLSQYYFERSLEGPAGYLESIAALTAGIASSILHSACRSSSKPEGQLRHVDMVNLVVRTSTVTAVHGCPYCGLGRDPVERTVVMLMKDIAHLWGR